MSRAKTVLIVSPTTSVASAALSAVGRSGNTAVLVTSFAEARNQLLTETPHLLITELKLGEFNGLQLALRAVDAEIPVIVIADRGFANEVEQVGATWLSLEAMSGDALTAMTAQLLPDHGPSDTALGWYGDDAPSGGAAVPFWPYHISELRH